MKDDFDIMDAVDDDGWSEWVHPLPGYLMKCCDCGLVHEMDAHVGHIIERHSDGRFEWDYTANNENARDMVVMFRMRRKSPEQAQ